jgi:hypothetical protein
MMHGHEKSDPVIVATKPANKAEDALKRLRADPAISRHPLDKVRPRLPAVADSGDCWHSAGQAGQPSHPCHSRGCRVVTDVRYGQCCPRGCDVVLCGMVIRQRRTKAA